MLNKNLVRIVELELKNLKNVEYGDAKFVNYYNAQYRAELEDSDINGIYGQNGSGKTAIVDAFDILQNIMSGNSVSYHEYEGMFNDDKIMCISTVFYIEYYDEKYKVRYELKLKRCEEEKKIQIFSENIIYSQRSKSWIKQRNIRFVNPYYDTQSILDNVSAHTESENARAVSNINFFNSIQNLAVLCAQKNMSLFFNDIINKSYFKEKQNDEELMFSSVARALYDFARMRFQVVKVNQLGANYSNDMIPVNIHTESENEIIQGCIPLFIDGRGDIPTEIYEKLNKIVLAINVALKAIIPNLFIELVKTREEKNKDGDNVVQAEVYSNRNGKRFLIKYESDGIKRIISLLNYLISLYNNPGVCLVVDELDAGIFEYLLGELLAALSDEAKGQLIFTSHNLRVMEKLDKKNIICSTINPKNRFISLKGIEKTHNRRDFYIRTVVLGGQDEKIYDDSDLQDIDFAFKKAGSKEDSNIEIYFSDEFKKLMKESR